MKRMHPFFISALTVDFNIEVFSYPDHTGAPSGMTELCQGSNTTTYILPDNELIMNYTWHVLPDTAASLQPNGATVSAVWNENFYGNAEIFAEPQLAHCPGENSDTLQVWVTGPQHVPEICIVGNDETSGKYMVVWNKLDDASIVAYNIYRESNQAGVYLELRTQPAGDFSVFVDETSSPDVFPHSYRISHTDTCGNVSEMRPPHNTIHLSANIGTGGENNLNGSPYTGIAFLTYDIYRGTEKNALSLLAQINSNVTSYSDFDPPGGMVYYQVVVESDGQCAPTKKALDYNRSSSNIAESGIINVENPGIQMVQVCPNPSNGSFTVSLPESNSFPGSLNIISMTGQLVSTVTFEGTTKTLHMDDLPVGVYTLILTCGERHLTQRLVILK
ncbi:MAG: T9SS type A sorting domain-containing protein [Bacteroidales bacterium]|nr:T9SS type A sorting domain-containing protein [Bacteroidales bacterium]MDT8430411.1 T9SS type A sorting domain-containing protein [Bacteroidales bacterium]